jgi:hypothetical protein
MFMLCISLAAPRQIAENLFTELLFAEKYCLNFAKKNYFCRISDLPNFY